MNLSRNIFAWLIPLSLDIVEKTKRRLILPMLEMTTNQEIIEHPAREIDSKMLEIASVSPSEL